VVKGSIDRHEQRVHMILDVIETRDLRQIGSVEVENDQGDIASLQNQAVERLAKIMNVSATPEMLRESTGKVAPAAYESYLKALGYMQRYDKPENLDLAINELATAVKKDPHFAVGFAALGEAYRLKYQVEHDAKWIEQATENCKRAQELDDRLSGAYVTLGLIHSDAGKHDLALQEFQKALQMNPRDSDALSGLAHAYENAGRTQEAEAAFKRAAGLRPDYWDGYNSLGLFYDRQRRYGEAIVQMKRAIELTPDNAQAYFNLGALYLDSGDSRNIGDAEAALKKSLSLNPSYPAYANLGYLYLQQNRYAESAAMTEKALQYNARDEIGWENLIIAYSWLKETDKLAAARAKELALIEEKIKLKPQDPLLQANLGQLYATLGQTGNAPRHLEAALALTPNDPTVLITVAEGYEALGERRQALGIVQQALQKGYSMDDLKRDPSLQSLLSDPGFHTTAGK